MRSRRGRVSVRVRVGIGRVRAAQAPRSASAHLPGAVRLPAGTAVAADSAAIVGWCDRSLRRGGRIEQACGHLVGGRLASHGSLRGQRAGVLRAATDGERADRSAGGSASRRSGDGLRACCRRLKRLRKPGNCIGGSGGHGRSRCRGSGRIAAAARGIRRCGCLIPCRPRRAPRRSP